MSSKKNVLITVIILTVLLGISPFIFSQERTKSVQVSRTDSAPTIDGLIEDACWKNIEPQSGFFQFDPVNGVKASEETFVWMVYDQKNIYLAFLLTKHTLNNT